MICGRPLLQARKREIACVRNKLLSLARMASEESQKATKLASGDVGLLEANAKVPR